MLIFPAPIISGSILAHRSSFSTFGRVQIYGATSLIPVYGFDIGGRERDGDQRYTFRELLETVGPIADSMGLKTLPVFTNLRHLDDTPGFWGDQFVGFALAAVAYLLRSNTNPVYVASTGDPLSVEGQPPQGAHPLTAWPLSSYELPIVMPYVDVSRLARVATVAGNEAAMSNLRVCFCSRAGALNCGSCEKCVRTQLELLAVTGKKSHSCFDAPLTVEAVKNIVIASTVAAVFYYEMITPLRKAGHGEFAKAVNERLYAFKQHQRWLREEGVKGAIKRFDRSHLGGRISKFVESIRA